MVKTLFFALSAMLFQALLTQPTSAQVAETFPQLVSVASDGTQGNGDVDELSSISADGHYIAFTSGSSNLISGDTNGANDVFVRNWVTGLTERVSIASDGSQGNCGSAYPNISTDGRYVAFYSCSSNLVTGDTNGKGDIYVHDRTTGLTERVSIASDGSQANGGSNFPTISADGRYVAFDSGASNLVPGDTNGISDIFVHDRTTSLTERVSIASDGIQGNDKTDYSQISADGRYVSFFSDASNLVPNDTNVRADIFVTRNSLFGATSSQPPVADAGLDQTVHIGTVATLDGSESTDPDGGYPLSYHWFFTSVPQGSNAVINNPSAVNPTFLANVSGNYLVSLVVTDSGRMPSQPTQVQISTINTPPIADAGVNQLITAVGSQVILDGSNSYDVDGDTINYQWNITSKPSGSNAELSDQTIEKPTFTADLEGRYIFRLVVSDEWSNSNPDEVIIGFDNIQPVANAGGNQVVVVGDTTTLIGNQSTDANGDNLTYRWSIVSVPQGSQAILTNANNVQTSFTTDVIGQYVINLVANDGFLDSTPSTITVMAISYEEHATNEALVSTVTAINNVPVDFFNNPNNVNALTNKINAALVNISSGNYADALNQLQNDILQKTDGCAANNAPDNNDWITTENKNPTQEEIQEACQKQSPVYSLITQAIGYLQSLI